MFDKYHFARIMEKWIEFWTRRIFISFKNLLMMRIKMKLGLLFPNLFTYPFFL